MSKPQTRAEHHADSPEQNVRESRRLVRKALERWAVGRENAMSGRKLAGIVPLKATTVRDIVAELRDDPDGPPIGNCGDGYFVIDSAGEFDRWAEGVKEEIATKHERLQANRQSWHRRDSP